MLRQAHNHVFSAVRSSTGQTSARVHHAYLSQLPSVLEETENQAPRWVRRQILQKGKAKEEEEIVLPRTKQVPRFRSKHLTSEATKAKDDTKGSMKLLEPHVLSQRLKKLCDRGKLDEAVSLLKNSPLDAQNTPVWNTVIWEAMKLKRYKLAYSLYTDMKRRGHNPTTRTYLTMFNGLARIGDFSRHTQLLKNVRSLYEGYTRHIKSVQRVNPTDTELSIDPIAPYIKILGDAGCYNEIFETFYSLEPDGPLAANPLIFTSMFQALAFRPDADTPTYRQADARLLWSQAVKTSKGNPNFIIDSHLTTSAISALARGQALDHDLGFQIARDFYGLSPPGASRVNPKFPLSPQSLSAILRLCNISNSHDLCIEFFNQIKRRPAEMGGVEVLDRLHSEEVLRAYQALNVPASGYQSLQMIEWMLRQELTGPNGGRIRPQASTFHIALVTCWHSADWNSATRIFDLMTGYHLHDFIDGAIAEHPRLDQRIKGRNILPTVETISSLARTACATRNRAHMRQCLRLVDYLGLDTLLTRTTEVADESRKTLKSRSFLITKLAQGIVDLVDYVLGGTTDQKFPGQLNRWKQLSERAKMELRDNGEAALIPTLQKTEGSPLVMAGRGRKEGIGRG